MLKIIQLEESAANSIVLQNDAFFSICSCFNCSSLSSNYDSFIVFEVAYASLKSSSNTGATSSLKQIYPLFYCYQLTLLDLFRLVATYLFRLANALLKMRKNNSIIL